MNLSTMQRRQPRKSMLGTHREYNFQLLPDPAPKSTKSMLGTHRDYSVQLLPDSLPKGPKNTSSFGSKFIYSSNPFHIRININGQRKGAAVLTGIITFSRNEDIQLNVDGVMVIKEICSWCKTQFYY